MGQILSTAYAAAESRNRAALASGQAAFETAPDLPDDDELTEDDARDQAEAELLTTAEPLADWIAKRCDCDQGRAPIDVARFEDVDLIDCDRVPVLLACIVAGDYAQMKAAACRLRTLYVKAERKTARGACRAADDRERAVIGITLEPPRYGMTGPECGVQQQLRIGYVHEDAQALDAPEYIARGSVRAGHQAISGTVYASTTDAMQARIFGVRQ